MERPRGYRVTTWPNRERHRPGFTLSAYTPQQLDRARHPYELGPGDRVYLFIDDAVHGIGSRACGVDVLPEHALLAESAASSGCEFSPAVEQLSRR